MQARVSRSILSNLMRKYSHFPNSRIIDQPPQFSSAGAHFSSIPNRPARSDRRRDSRTEDRFLGNLNFGDERDGDSAANPTRPLRGDINHMPMGNERRVRDDRSESHQDPPSLREKDETFAPKFDFGGIDKGENSRPAEETPVAEVAPPEEADEIFKKMKETGLIPNAVAMLDGLCKDGLVQDAMKLFGLMREKGTIPEVVVYTAVVEGFCKVAKFEDAIRIFRKMQKKGIVPNSFSYGVVIQGLCKGKRLEDAVEFCMEMLDSGHTPNAATLTGLVDVFCKEKGGEEAEGLLRSLRDKGFAIDERAVREFLDKKGPYSSMVWEAIFGKRNSHRPF